ncbi:hypothetical protein A1D23_13195 [Chelonobacter oris]|uniref:hypothetical protein n=1 Tax=Chelonobacter oris TaxID=505317 RepID=UPI002449179D|nr:hypothetical protein [Chelonobacter oris]MDH3001501.1 hypothetical protein [Chelonobacter oris]
MTTFNKINNPMYSAISSFTQNEDGSISANYVIGTGTDSDGTVTDFTPIVRENKWIEAEQAQIIASKPLVKEDIGKTPNCIMLDRIYAYLKESGQIVI